MNLSIISPEAILYKGEATGVIVPGKGGRFEVLDNHAPIISSLTAGEVVCRGKEDKSFTIKGGFIEVKHNNVTICVD